MRRLILLSAAFMTLAGCANKAEVEQLKTQIADLEAKVQELEKGKGGGSAAAAAGSATDQAAEEAAIALYKEIDTLIGDAEFKPAKKKLDELLTKYKSTKAASRAVRLKRELDVIGTKVVTPEMDKWFNGSDGALNLESGSTLVVFWEVWCPHCKREVPKIQATYEKFQGKMNVVGLTKVTKSATDEKVTDFIKEQKLTYPIAKETGDASQAFAVSGIPAAAIVKDGEVVWRGHPGKLTDDLINKIIGG